MIIDYYPEAPKYFLFGVTLQDSIYEPQNGTTLGPLGRYLDP